MIIPAFDLINNKVVRLYQGNYVHQKNYNINIYSHLKDYKLKGVTKVHLVDLDGARDIKNRQLKLLKNILSEIPIPIQVGGGIRTEKDISIFLQMGSQQVVIGSSAINNKTEVKKWLNMYGSDSIILALDVNINSSNDKLIAINGWQKTTNITLEEVIEYFLPYGLKHVLCTDISRDGTLSGPNFKLYSDISRNFTQIKFQASGGVGTIEDIISLKQNGVNSVIIGRSLLEKKFTIEEALKCWQNE